MEPTSHGGIPGGTGRGALDAGYSRRCPPINPKAADRHRLLTDRNAYITFLEAQVERANEAAMEAESVGAGLRQIQMRVEELEERVRSTGWTREPAQEPSAAQSGTEDQLRFMEGRMQRLEHTVGVTHDPMQLARHMQMLEHAIGEVRVVAAAEVARLRNEVSVTLEELRQHFEERLEAIREDVGDRVQAFHCFADEGASAVIHEAQATCVRLADDAMGAVECSQRKLEELSRCTESSHVRLEELAKRTEESLEKLRMDIIGVRAELVGSAQPSEFPLGLGRGTDHITNELADVLERRLATRLGQQVMQLSDILKRVVQAQVAMQRHHVVRAGPQSDFSAPVGSNGLNGATSSSLERTGTPANVASDARRRAAIDELYRELRQLEECSCGTAAVQVRGSSQHIARKAGAHGGWCRAQGTTRCPQSTTRTAVILVGRSMRISQVVADEFGM